MNQVTSPSQYALLSADDRRRVLAQIKATVDVAAKLAEVAHMEAALARDADRASIDERRDSIRAETEQLKAEVTRLEAAAARDNTWERFRASAERSRAETKKAAEEEERERQRLVFEKR
ncbi:uncharacterized protein H6S33_004923 [Morchella sextelata]|uniref:uncharacterized protein n=1 Tax=Morchella sextelata TaxID=1174677 RepID=UPI001D053B80|nr:uncharacterized protein H6S33_004923 [Morchella sextelata]KAH0604941.1 hypothetical protein H6S33_004923 [Morchella sextelata]